MFSAKRFGHTLFRLKKILGDVSSWGVIEYE